MRLLRIAASLLLLLMAGPALAQFTCSPITVSSVTGTYTPTGTLNLTGNISMTCVRSSGNKSQTLWIGMNNGTGSRALTSPGAPAATLAYGLYREPGNTGSWTTGIGQAPGSGTAGGFAVPISFAGNDTITVSQNYYLQVVSGNWVRAGALATGNPYKDTITMTTRIATNAGTLLGTNTFTPSIDVPAYCQLTSPGTLILNYTSFAATGSGTSPFTVQCTALMGYTFSFDTPPVNPLALTYSLTADNPLTSTGAVQNYNVTGTITGPQSGKWTAGNCGAGLCTWSETRQLTLTY
jgi:hypothetical protein